MASSTTCHKLCVFLLVLALYVTVTLSYPYSLHKRQPITDCDTNREVSLVCYECSKSYYDSFNQVYALCCGNDEIRNYCSRIYTEPPKRVAPMM